MCSWWIRWKNSLEAFFAFFLVYKYSWTKAYIAVQCFVSGDENSSGREWIWSSSPFKDDEGHQAQQHCSQYRGVDGNEVVTQPMESLQPRVSCGHALRRTVRRSLDCIQDIWWSTRRRIRGRRKGRRRRCSIWKRRRKGWAVRTIYICWRKGTKTKKKTKSVSC